jgi:hypothetical protein
VVSTKLLIHKPGEILWEQAAGIPEVCDPNSLSFKDIKTRSLSTLLS